MLDFGTEDGCQCDCGAWDADCDDPGQAVSGCGTSSTIQKCEDQGKCG